MSLVACPQCKKKISENARACPRCGAEIDSQIVQAAASGDLQKVRSMLDGGSSINAVDWDGCTALGRASAEGHIEIVKLLLEEGADSSVANTRALSEAFRHGHSQVVQFLLDSVDGWQREVLSRALDKAFQEDHSEPVQRFLDSVDGWNDDDLANVLGQAIHHDWRDLVSVLVEQVGVNCSYKSYTPLITAAECNKPDIARFLLDNGAEIERRSGHYEMTALAYAVRNGNAEMVRLLLERGADPDCGDDKNDWTPLSWAARNGNIEMARLALKCGANINAKINDSTLLMIVLGEMYDVTLRHRSSLLKPQHHIVKKKSFLIDMIKFLLANGADVNTEGSNGLTPLMYVCEVGDLEMARLFLEKGADPNIKSTFGINIDNNAMGLALVNGHDQIVELLKQYGGKKIWYQIYF